jgi:hypothetical protein
MNDAGGTVKQVDREKVWFCSKCWSLINWNMVTNNIKY